MMRTYRTLLPIFAATALFGITVPMCFGDTADEQIAAASALYDAHDFAKAAKVLDAFVLAHPKSQKTAAVALTLGRCHTLLKQYGAAIPAYQRSIAAGDSGTRTLAELGLGEAALQTGKWSIAQSALDSATKTELTPEQAPIAWDWLGQADYQLAKYAPSEQAYLHVIREYPDSSYAPDAQFGAGLAALKQNHDDDAKNYFSQLVGSNSQSPDKPQARLLIAQLDLSAKKFRTARREFEISLSTDKSDTSIVHEARSGLISALLALGDDAAAATQLQVSISDMSANNTEKPRAELMLGHALYRQKKFAEASSAYITAESTNDTHIAAEAAYWAGNSASQLGQTQTADAAYAKARALDPNGTYAQKAVERLNSSLVNSDSTTDLAASLSSLPYAQRGAGINRLARLYIIKKQYVLAAATLTKYWSAIPGGDSTGEESYLLGVSDANMQNSVPALAAFTTTIEKAPGADWNTDAHLQRAWLELNAGKSAAAEADARFVLDAHTQKALSHDTRQQVWLALLQAQLNQKEWQAAQDTANDALGDNPTPDTTATLLYAKAIVLGKLDHGDQAQPIWQTLATQYHSSPYGAEAGTHLADAKFNSKDYAGALQAYKQLLADYPASAGTADVQFKLGSTLYNLAQYTDAAAAFDAAAASRITTAPDQALYWAGAAFEKAGKNSLAIARLTTLVTKYPDSTWVSKAKIRMAALKAVS